MRASSTLDRSLQVHSLRELVIPEIVLWILGIAIITARQAWDFANFNSPWPLQLVIGALLGLAAGALSGALVRATPLRARVARRLAPLRGIPHTIPNYVVIGIAAGLCEETLFRAALQPWIGLWLASAVFAVAHAGTAQLYRGLSAGKLAYLTMAFGAGLALGVVYQRYGLLASAAAHAGFDAAILTVMRPLLTGPESAA